jgi:hypothetical protein
MVKEDYIIETKTGKCRVREFCAMNFNTFNASAFLYFQVNTRFEYKYLENNRVLLSRNNMDLEIPKEDFEKRFTILENVK